MAEATNVAGLLGGLAGGIAGGLLGGGLGALLGADITSAVAELRVHSILEGGVLTDEYAGAEQTPILGVPNAVLNATADELATGRGRERNDQQPYPLLGWVELAWVKQPLVK